MKIILGADHGGFKIKKEIKDWLTKQKYEVEDTGATKLEAEDDYVDYAAAVGEALMDEPETRGILFCRNGFGMTITANRFPGVRCGLAFDEKAVKLGRHDDNINCLSIAADYFKVESVKKMIEVFLSEEYSNNERFNRRLQKLDELTEACGDECGDGCCGGGCGNC